MTPETSGGIPTVMKAISDGLRHQFHFNFLISSNLGATLFQDHLGVCVTTVRNMGHFMSTPIAPTFPFHLRALEGSHDLIVVHAPFPLADLAGLLGAFRRTPLIVHWHSDIVRQVNFEKVYRRSLRSTLMRARAVIVAGEKLIEASQILKEFEEKCEIIPFGVDAKYWSDLSPEDYKVAKGLQRSSPRLILAVGRLVPYKGFSTLVEAMNHIDGELWIVGKGPLEEVLRAQIGSGSAKGRIRLLGELSRSELRRLYHVARLLCLPSISNAEAFGLVQLEAMSAGAPVVNTALETMVPLVAREMREGLTVAPGDVGALTAAINRLLGDSNLRDRLGQASRVRAASTFAENLFLERVGSLYEKVIGG
jgi:rhamnosyl/mannosyltransferase